MSRKIAVIRGDGIGPEVVEATLAVLDAAGLRPGGRVDANFIECPMGLRVYEEEGTPLTDETFRELASADAILLGAIMTPSEPPPGYRSGLLRIRRELDLYANVEGTWFWAGIGKPQQFPTNEVQLAGDLAPGQRVKVTFDLRGNEYKERYYVNLSAWRVEPDEAAPGEPQAGAPEAFDTDAFIPGEEVDTEVEFDAPAF